MSFNPADFAPIAERNPSEELRVVFTKSPAASAGLSCYIFSDYIKHLTHKRGIDVILLDNGSLVVLEFNDNNEIVFDTTSLTLKELKIALDRGDSMSDICDLNVTEIVSDHKHLFSLIEMAKGLIKEED